MRQRVPGSWIVAGWLTILLHICPVTAAAAIELPQSDGTRLLLGSPAQRVITLAPNLAEMMFAADAGHVLIATVEFSDYPPQAGDLPRIGDAFRFDLERIMALRPDLVIGWSSGNPSAALTRLESLGFTVWRTEMRRPSDIADTLEHIALATGSGTGGVEAAREVRRRLAALEVQYGGAEQVRYFYQVAERPLVTLNGEHIVSRGLAICGGENAFATEPVIAPQVTLESVLLADPEVMIAPRLPDSADPLKHWLSWPRLQAARNHAFIHLSADHISRATPRMLDSLEIACNLLHQYRLGGTTRQERP